MKKGTRFRAQPPRIFIIGSAPFPRGPKKERAMISHGQKHELSKVAYTVSTSSIID